MVDTCHPAHLISSLPNPIQIKTQHTQPNRSISHNDKLAGASSGVLEFDGTVARGGRVGSASSGSGSGGEGAHCCGGRVPVPTVAGVGRALRVFGRMLVSKYLNILLLAAPFGVLARYLKWGPGPVFFLNFVCV